MGTTLSDLAPPLGAKKRKKRIGRGDGSGHGTTACRGQKGQSARTGANYKPWFEGGQMPLVRRMPKRGFKNPFRIAYYPVNLGQLSQVFKENQTVDVDVLKTHGLVPRTADHVKVLAEGALSLPLTLKVHAYSKTAAEKIKAAGGKAEVVALNAKTKTDKTASK